MKIKDIKLPKVKDPRMTVEEAGKAFALFGVSGICISCGTKTKGQSLCDVCNARGLDAYE